MNDFRFSPRPNRASEVGWMPWSAEAFARAQREDKPILLSISAVWCHWCHVMDETSYSDPGVISAINALFVPVRVDNDQRPDVNARYNMGGWPTTAFLAPDGSTLTGATYLPPAQMRRAVEEIAEFYREHKSEIAERSLALRSKGISYKPVESGELRESMIVRLVEEIGDTFDEEFGGFGDAPKFPQPELLELLLSEWRISSDQRLYEMVSKTIRGMSQGGMYDHVEGGFFRYSTTRDWSVPHYEKMAEDHAGLLRVLAQLVLFAYTGDFENTLTSASRYVRTVLRDPATGFFAGSQDADEAYYTLPPEERRKRQPPFVDRTSYTNWTCALAGALILTGRALDDDELIGENLVALDRVEELLLDPDGFVYHVLSAGEPPRVRGLLTDQVAYVRALTDAHEISGEDRFLQRARTMADRLLERFEAPDGGFYDRIALEAPIGRLEILDRPIGDNGILAETLLRLDLLASEPRYRVAAERALIIHAKNFASAGAFAAPHVRALRRYLGENLAVRVVGTAKATDAFREAALRLPTPLLAIRTISPAGAHAFALPAAPHPAAYVCSGTTCAAPATEAAGLRAAYESLRAETSAAAPRT
jgi:uncharacterized protein